MEYSPTFTKQTKMMTPKEKSEELISRFITVQNKWYLDNLVDGLRISQAKQCTIIAVEEMIKELDDLYSSANVSDSSEIEVKNKSAFWNEVLTELNRNK